MIKSTRKIILLLAVLLCSTSTIAQNMTDTNMTQTNIPSGPIVEINTSLGKLSIKLYDETPIHRDNFIKLVEDGYYNGVLFHRVIKDFMVQTGDPDSKNAAPGVGLGTGDPGYTLEAEINYPKFYHKYGALAAARTADQVNPERRSSGSQFYIVTGKKYNEPTLTQMQRRMNEQAKMDYFNKLKKENMDKIKAAYSDKVALEELRQELIRQVEENVKDTTMPDDIIATYSTIGGTPHLDGQYTVFGEVIEGMEIIEQIQKVETDRNDRPLNDIKITSITVLK